MKLSTLKAFKEELKSIKEKGLTISEYCTTVGKSYSTYSAKINNVKKSMSEYANECEEIISLYESLQTRKNTSFKSKFTTSVREETIEEEDEKDDFDGKTQVIYNRGSSSNKLISYKVIVAKRDTKNWEVTLSRDEVEQLFGLYTYYGGNITARNVANEFPKFTLPEIKRLFRAFRLTKDSAWFAPHMLEEMTEQELSEYRMHLKERAAFKYADSRQERDFKNQINKMASEINKLKDFKANLDDVLKTELNVRPEPITIKKSITDNTLMLYMSDMHIGARVDDRAIYDNKYDMNVVYSRIDKIIENLKEYKTFNKIVVVNTGDSLDGMDEQTSRRDHYLPQNMNNQEQLTNFVLAMEYLFRGMIVNDCANAYAYISVPCGNHKK